MRHGGNRNELAQLAGCRPEEILDFSVNLNPFGPPEGLFPVYFRAFDSAESYPEPYCGSLCELAARKLGIGRENLLFGNGSNQLLYLLPRVFEAKRAVVMAPGYLEYRGACESCGLECVPFLLEADMTADWEKLERMIRPGDLVMLGNPNNPNGGVCPASELSALIQRHPDSYFVVDEAFMEFLPEGFSLVPHALSPHVAVLRSMTKFYAVPGIRIGYCIASEEVIGKLRRLQPEWMLGAAALSVAEFLFSMEDSYARRCRSGTAQLREELSSALKTLPGVTVYPSMANFLLVKGRDLREPLLKKYRIAVRSCGNFEGLDDSFFRLAVRTREENERLVSALSDLLTPGRVHIAGTRVRKPALMIQGTASNAGKSILVSGFCRILLQDGFRIAPFKAQNMALNSFVTADGGEMGRAQVVQAEAARLDPDVRMNPILLKPSSDMGSQVIVRGKPIGCMKVREYYAHKKELWKEVCRCYDELAELYDALILEGAGSPGEVNLKSGDLVNMRMAQYAQAPVILAGDIDRGGVYASFLGTYATLDPSERRLLYGFLVNKFRGDPTLLAPAHDYVRKMTGHPVLGVVDYLRDIGLPEEDSVNFSLIRPAPKLEKTLDAVLIGLGHIANFTDFTPLELEPDVTIRKIHCAEEFGEPDLVILPGSKSVADDMAFLESSGLAEKIRTAVGRGAWFLGVCGGLQLAGKVLLDPEHVESERESVTCLGLLPLETVMRKEKTLRQTKGRMLADGTLVSGYEIHNGVTTCREDCYVLMEGADSSPVGFGAGRIFTTYLHGIFDDDHFRRKFLNRIRQARGMEALADGTAHYGTEESLNRLADHLRSRIDLKALYARMGLKRGGK